MPLIGLPPIAYLEALVRPAVAIGILSLAANFLLQLTLLTWADLTFALPMTSPSYVVITIIGVLALGEHVSLVHWGGRPADPLRRDPGRTHQAANARERHRMIKWLLVAAIIACNCCADLMNTAGMRRNGEVDGLGPRGIARLIRALVRNRFVLGGIAANAFGFFTLMSLLSVANVSFAVPATAGSFVIETGLAKVILKEDVHWQRWLGAAVIACGVALLALP